MHARTAGATGQAILEAAYRCIIRQGYAAVSLRQIAREAGVALSQLHYCLTLASRDPEARQQVRRVFQALSDEAARRLPQLCQRDESGEVAGPAARRPAFRMRPLSPGVLGRLVVATLYGLALQLLVDGADESQEPEWFVELMAAVSPAGE